MIKIFLPYHYILVTLIGFSFMLLLSGFSYQRIAKKSSEKSPSKASFYELKAMSIDNEEISFEQEEEDEKNQGSVFLIRFKG